MGLLAAIKRLSFSLLVAFNWLYAFFSRRPKLHDSRFARIDELASPTAPAPDQEGEGSLILGVSHLSRVLRVKPTAKRRELGNLLVCAPTRGGKGLLATAQLLTWRHSVVVNDIKGDLFTQTARYRATLGPVFVIDPTGVGHRFDPLSGKTTEDEFYSAATQLLYKSDERQPIFTQRATVMLTQLFLAARKEGRAPLPYARETIRLGLSATAHRLHAISPELATQFLTLDLGQANLGDAFLISWGRLTPACSDRNRCPLAGRCRLPVPGPHHRGAASHGLPTLAGARPSCPCAGCPSRLGDTY